MPPPGDDDRLSVLEEIARSRRSNLRMDADRPVADDLVDRLLDMAATAPNHRRTFPWRFRVLTDDARAALGEAVAAHLVAAGDPPEKVAKARAKYLRAPTIVVAAARAGDSATMTAENRDAVSAALQTLLLGATAAGLASLWSTGAAVESSEVREVCGFDPTDRVVGIIYLGWPTSGAPDNERPKPDVVRLGGGSS